MIMSRNRETLWIALGLVMMIVLVYGQTIYFDFIHFDEEQYVTRNPHVLSGLTWEGVRWAFTSLEAGFWHPLTWLSLMLDHELYGMHAGGYHGTNVLLHLGNTLLLFWALMRMTGAPWRSGMVAALFALHPLHVESVAWIAQRKDVLSTFFWMLTLLCYVRYVEQPGRQRYLPVMVVFILGLMSKPMLVTLPFILLLLDYWPLGRLRIESVMVTGVAKRFDKRPLLFLLKEKAPFFFMAFLFSALTFHAEQQAGALPSITELSFPVRAANAIISYTLYIYKMFWPTALAVFYPHPGMWPLLQVVFSGLLLVLVTSLALLRWRSAPYLAAGWFWYLGALLPVSGLVQVGSHGMADRYTYIPLIGLFIICTWGAGDTFTAWKGIKRRLMVGLAAGIIITACTVLTWQQLQYWRNSITLFSHAIGVTRDNYLAHNNLGAVFMTMGYPEAAEPHFRTALTVLPTYAVANNNLGNIMLGKERYDEAIEYFQKALQSNPAYNVVYRNLGDAYLRKGDCEKAISVYKKALTYDNRNAEIYNNMGATLVCRGELEKAQRQFETALRIKPDFAFAADNLRKVQSKLTKEKLR